MKKSLLQSFIELFGFALVGMLFFVWFLGNHENRNQQSFQGNETLKAELEYYEANGNDEVVIRNDEYQESKSKYERPEPVSGKARKVDYVSAKKKKKERTESNYTRAKRNAETVRSWERGT